MRTHNNHRYVLYQLIIHQYSARTPASGLHVHQYSAPHAARPNSLFSERKIFRPAIWLVTGNLENPLEPPLELVTSANQDRLLTHKMASNILYKCKVDKSESYMEVNTLGNVQNNNKYKLVLWKINVFRCYLMLQSAFFHKYKLRHYRYSNECECNHTVEVFLHNDLEEIMFAYKQWWVCSHVLKS